MAQTILILALNEVDPCEKECGELPTVLVLAIARVDFSGLY